VRRSTSLSLALLALSLAAATAARAQDCGVAPTGTSYSRVRFGSEAYDSGYRTGRPAVSSVSHSFLPPDYDVGAEAAATVDADAFGTSANVGGSMAIDPIYTRGASSNASGTWRDCLVIEGHVGDGRLHLPIHLDGARTLSFSTGGAYLPPQDAPPIARALANLGCSAFTVGVFAPDTCPDFAYDWSDSGDLDETVELIAPFTFGAPLDLRIDPTVSVGLGYTPSGAAGLLTGSAAIDLSGTLLAATITDANGTPLPAATIAAESGFDYLKVPEPTAALGAVVALATLRGRQSFAITRSA
jgi:hypothetical protein